MKSEANLAASLKADWSPQARGATKKLLARLGAYSRAQELVQITLGTNANTPLTPTDVKTIAARFDAVEDNEFTTNATGGSFYGFQVPSAQQDEFITAMLEKGFDRASVAKLDFVYEKQNPLFDRLMGALG